MYRSTCHQLHVSVSVGVCVSVRVGVRLYMCVPRLQLRTLHLAYIHACTWLRVHELCTQEAGSMIMMVHYPSVFRL